MIDDTSPLHGEAPTTEVGDGDGQPSSTASLPSPATTLMPSALMAPAAFGPFRPDIPEVERVAGLRGLAVGVAAHCGSNHPAVNALRRAETDIATSDQALAAFDAMPATTRSGDAGGRMIVLIVSLAGYTTRGPTFNGTVDGATIVIRSTTPFCDAARALLAQGVAQDAPFAMRHAGQDHGALRSTVGVAAGLSVEDTGGKPTFRTYKPYDGRSRVAGGPPMRPATDQSFGAPEQKDASTACPAHQIDGGQR